MLLVAIRLGGLKRVRASLNMMGRGFTKAEADERYAERDITYLFSTGENGTVIDGFGTAMFINHSCEPNCESDNIGSQVFIVAIRDIVAGEELTYEYTCNDSDEDEADCYCGRGEVPGDDVQ